jgi:hypothetical protein
MDTRPAHPWRGGPGMCATQSCLDLANCDDAAGGLNYERGGRGEVVPCFIERSGWQYCVIASMLSTTVLHDVSV